MDDFEKKYNVLKIPVPEEQSWWTRRRKRKEDRGKRKEVPTHVRVLIYEQRLSMVLELYYRKAGGKREGGKRESGHGQKERRGKRKERRGGWWGV